MMKRYFSGLRNVAMRLRRALPVTVGAIILILVVIACQSVQRAVVTLPNVPGASYIGSRECEQCHEQIYRDFQTADHARLIARGTNSIHAGCESCHGPASLHSESGGDIKPPYSFAAGRPQFSTYGARLAIEPVRSMDAVCYQCHLDVQGKFNLPSHHPVPEGKLSCTECHSPHKGSIHRGGNALLAENEKCLRCHAAQRGPYVFEHEATREGCTTCHVAHGSVNAKLLRERDSNLCMKCHFQRVTGGRVLIGGSDHTVRMQQGTCWTAGCHEAVHGSRVTSSLRF